MKIVMTESNTTFSICDADNNVVVAFKAENVRYEVDVLGLMKTVGELKLNLGDFIEKLISKTEEESEDDENWIPWEVGGECPISKSHLVDVKYRDGSIDYRRLHAGSYDWTHCNGPYDIVAYRIPK